VIDDSKPVARRVACLLFLGSLSLYLLTAGGSLSSTDATVMFDLTRNLVERRSIALSDNLLGLEANRGVDGRFYSQYGLGQSLYNIPFYVAGVAARDLAGISVGKPDTIPKAVVALGSTVTTAACVAVLWLLAFALSGAARPALAAALTAAIASPLWPYSKFGFSVPLTALLLAGAAALLWRATHARGMRWALGAGACVGFAWLTRHEIAVVLVPVSFYLWIEARRREWAAGELRGQLLALWGAAATGGAAWALYNFVRFGSFTYVGYTPWFTGEGYLGFLASPIGAVLLFCPVAALWIFASMRTRLSPGERILLLAPGVVLYLLYGSLHDWMGGRSYGPRYLVPALVLLAPTCAVFLRDASRLGRKMAAAVVIVSCLVQVPGIVVDYSKVSLERARSATASSVDDGRVPWAESPLVLNTAAAWTVLPANLKYLTGQAAPPAPVPQAGPDDREFAQRFAFSVDFWWAYLIYLGVLPRSIGLAIAGGCAASALLLLGWAWRLSGVYDERRGPASSPAHRRRSA
jgi:hypothetical protein